MSSKTQKPNPRHQSESQKNYQPDASENDDFLHQNREREKIIEQNIKLKLQIHELSNELDQLLSKDKQRKKQSQQIQDKGLEQNEPALKEKKQKIQKQKLQILELKNKIFALKSQLENVYNTRNLMKKEDQLKKLKEQIETLQQQKISLKSIKEKRDLELQNLRKQEQFEDKIDDLKKQVLKVKDDSRLVNQKIIDSERILRKNHEQFIKKQERVKELEQKLMHHKEKSKNRKPIQTVSPQMILQLEEQIAELQQERRETEKLWQMKVKAIDAEYTQKKIEQEKKLLILKEKEREFKLNELKIKQLRKLVRHNIAQKKASRVKTQDVDMSQYRNKRNIKYLQ